MQKLTLAALLMAVVTGYAQPRLRKSILSTEKNNFYSIQKEFHNYWKDKTVEKEEEENAEEGGYQQFARWEHFMKTRAYPSGKIPNPDILLNEHMRTKNERTMQPQIQSASWSFIGPPVVPNSGGGAGRINCIAFHPANPLTIYVGAACGGMWQTADGGVTWSSTTDQLASISVADIAIDPVNPNNIYLATGDGYGYEVWGNDFWGGTYTAGVMKSTDGGLTWNAAGLSYNQTQSEIIQRLIINPQNPDILLACTRNAIYRTIDGAATWTNVKAGHFYDLEFNALNPNVVYAVDDDRVYRSTNGGATFAIYSNSLNSTGRISIDVTPADTNIIYAFTQNADFYKSTNGGFSFTPMVNPSGTFYGYYDCVLAVSPVNPQRVVVGGVSTYMSNNGGLIWTTIDNNGGANDYVHADKKALEFFPGSNDTIYNGNDGGLFRTTNAGTTWTDLSNGIDIKQYYRMSSSEVNPSVLYAGAQDNGTDQWQNGVWTQVFGGDGMDCASDYNDVNTAYVSYQYGAFSRTTDGGLSFTNISPGSNGDWITPIAQDPVNPNTIYIGYTDLYKSTDKGTTWTNLSPPFIDNITHIAVAKSNTSYIYVCNLDEIYMTNNGGTSWNSIAAGLPLAQAAMTRVIVSPSNPQHVWVTFSGYSNGLKVYKSTDGGSTWANISGTLPNIPVNCIVYQENTNDQLYIGTDFGVYYTDSGLNDWIPYQTNLPNVIVEDIEINYTAGKLRAATYGRGIWESDLNTTTLFAIDAGVQSITAPTGISCLAIINPVIVIQNYGLDTLYTVDINYLVDAMGPIVQPWNGALAHGQTAVVTINTMPVTGGIHTFTAYTSNPNSSADGNTGNDQKFSIFEADSTILPYPVTEGFENGPLPVNDWRLSGAVSMMGLEPYGGFGTSANSIRADFYNTISATGYFTSKRVNFTNSASPVRLYFNVAYAEYDATYHDTLNVSISTDCGSTWTNVYSKTGPVLATAAATQSVFYPQPAEWRAESINLDPWIGFPEVMARFEFKSGYGNQCYVDDINLYSGTVGVSSALYLTDVHIAPVPFVNTIYIQSGSAVQSLVITDVTGKIVTDLENINHRNLTVNTAQLARGVYFIKLYTGQGAVVKRVVKK